MAFLGMFEAQALNATCDIESGPIMALTTYSDLACRQIPPNDEQDDITTAFLVKDPSSYTALGNRIVFDSETYLIVRLARDGNYVRCQCREFHEA